MGDLRGASVRGVAVAQVGARGCPPGRAARALALVLGVGVALFPLFSPGYAQSSSGSTLAPGDALRITVWRKPELSGEFQILADSAIAGPFYRPLKVAGIPITDVERRVHSYLEQYESSPRVLVERRFSALPWWAKCETPGCIACPRKQPSRRR